MEFFSFLDTVIDSIESTVSFVWSEIFRFVSVLPAMVTHFYHHDVVPLLSEVKSLEDLFQHPKLLVILGLSGLFLVLGINLFTSVLVYLLRCLFTCICCCRRRKHYPSVKYDSKPRKMTIWTPAERLVEAKRWMRQAELDLNATKNDLASSAAPEWAALKCQQAAEKSLKACLISMDIGAVNVKGHDLHDLSVLTHDSYLVEISQKIQSLIGYIGRLRYPNYVPAPFVPHDVISEDQADEAVGLCNLLVSEINNKYMNFEEE